MINEVPKLTEKIQSRLDGEDGYVGLQGEQLDQAKIVAKEDLPDKIEDIARRTRNKQELDNKELVRVFELEADASVARAAEAIGIVFDENQFALQALRELETENEANPEGSFYHQRKAALDYLIKDHPETTKLANEQLVTAMEQNEDLKEATIREAQKVAIAIVTKLPFEQSGQGASEKLHRKEIGPIRDRIGIPAYDSLFQEIGIADTEDEISTSERYRLEADRILTDEFLRRSTTDERQVGIGNRSDEVRTLPSLSSEAAHRTGRLLASQLVDAVEQKSEENIEYLRGSSDWSTPDRYAVNKRIGEVVDNGLAGLTLGMIHAEDPPPTATDLRELRDKERNRMLNRSGTDYTDIRIAMFDAKFTAGFFTVSLDRAVNAEQGHDTEELYALNMALMEVLSSPGELTVDLTQLYKDIERNPDDYPLRVRQLFAINHPAGIDVDRSNTYLYGELREGAKLREELLKTEREAGFQTLRNATVETGPWLMEVQDLSKRIAEKIEGNVKGYSHREITAERFRQDLIREQTQSLVLEDLAQAFEDSVPPSLFASIVRDVRHPVYNDFSGVIRFIRDPETPDDQKKAAAVLYITRMQLEPSVDPERYPRDGSNLEIILRENLSSGESILSPQELIDIHNISFSRVDAANRRMAETPLTDRRNDTIRFREVLTELLDRNRSGTKPSSGTATNIFEGYTVLQVNSISSESYGDLHPPYFKIKQRTSLSNSIGFLRIKRSTDSYFSTRSDDEPGSTRDRNQKLTDITTRTEPIVNAFELATNNKAIEYLTTTEDEGTAERTPEPKPVKVTLGDRIGDYSTVLSFFGVQKTTELINHLSIRAEQTDERAVVDGFQSFERERKLAVLAEFADELQGDYEKALRAKSIWQSKKAVWESVRNSKLQIWDELCEKYSLSEFHTNYLQELRKAKNIDTFRSVFDERRDMNASAAIFEDLKRVPTTMDNLSSLRKAALESLFPEPADGTVNLGNIGYSSYQRGTNDRIQSAPTRFTLRSTRALSASVNDLSIEPGIINEVIEQKIDGLERVMQRLEENYGAEIGSAPTEDDIPQEQKTFPKVAEQSKAIVNTINALRKLLIDEEELVNGLNQARRVQVLRLQEAVEETFDSFPPEYQRAFRTDEGEENS